MSKIKNGRLDQYGAEPFEQQQFGTAGVEGVKRETALREAYISVTHRTSIPCLMTFFAFVTCTKNK